MKKTKLGKGAIEVNREMLKGLHPGEMTKIVELVQLVCEEMLEAAQLDSRRVLLSIGNPAVVKVDLRRLAKLRYDEVRDMLLKMSDMQRRLADEEFARLEKALGKK